MTSTRRALSAVLAAAALAAGCGGSRAEQRPAPAPQDRATAYYPLKVGHRWLYDEVAMGRAHRTWQSTVTQQLAEGRFVMEIAPVEQGVPGRAARLTLEVRPRGIFDGTRYMLEDPVEPGHKWLAITDVRTSERFEVVSLQQTADTPAGRFVGCALVVNTIREPGNVVQLTEVTWCRDIGMVETRIRIQKPGKPDIPVSHMKLTQFHAGTQRVYPRHLGQ
ncbi:MAG: hypothetical protein HY904_20345 [Deltaproteobacteria bacterium]|nr:hypothetical protein [Deltaproteobacteria bacterium]